MLLAVTPNIALLASHTLSLKSNVGRSGQQHIVNKLQWPKIVLGNIAYSHKDWQKKTRQILILQQLLHARDWLFKHYQSSAVNREFPSPLAYKKCTYFRHKKLYVLEKNFYHEKGFNQKTVFYWVWHRKVLPLAQHFYVLPCKKPFSDLYLFIFEHNFENK